MRKKSNPPLLLFKKTLLLLKNKRKFPAFHFLPFRHFSTPSSTELPLTHHQMFIPSHFFAYSKTDFSIHDPFSATDKRKAFQTKKILTNDLFCATIKTHGGIAQLVRAFGSHPRGRGFESLCLHYTNARHLSVSGIGITEA